MRERLRFWWRVLRLGTRQVNTAGGWAGTIFLALGAIAGIAAPLALHLSHWLIAVILLSLLVFVTAEGGYQVWHESDQERITAQAERDAARRDDGRDVRSRSVAAASTLASLVAGLDWEVGVWEKGSQASVPSKLEDAYRQFAQTAVGAAGELSDPDVRGRVNVHSRLTRFGLNLIGNAPQYRPEIATLLHEHAKSIIGALDAHQRGAKLPDYEAPPFEDPTKQTALFAWRSAC